METVLVTGSSGRVGRAVVAELLRRGHAVRGFDVAASATLVDSVVGDLGESSRPVKLARLDLGVAAKVLGYVPQDTWPEGM